MVRKYIAVTNNLLAAEGLSKRAQVDFLPGDVIKVYHKARNYIHLGHVLLTHPLLSSIKPNETPYRTIILSKERCKEVDLSSLKIMEDSIMTLEKFLKDFPTPAWEESIDRDFQFIDWDVTKAAIEK